MTGAKGALLYLKSIFGGDEEKNDKYFNKSTGTDGRDIQQGEDDRLLVDWWICLAEKGTGKPYKGKPHLQFDVAMMEKYYREP